MPQLLSKARCAVLLLLVGIRQTRGPLVWLDAKQTARLLGDYVGLALTEKRWATRPSRWSVRLTMQTLGPLACDSASVSCELLGEKVGVLPTLWNEEMILCRLAVILRTQTDEPLCLNEMQVTWWLLGDYDGDSRGLCECIMARGPKLLVLVITSVHRWPLLRLATAMQVIWA